MESSQGIYKAGENTIEFAPENTRQLEYGLRLVRDFRRTFWTFSNLFHESY